jgi:hypothetical protein
VISRSTTVSSIPPNPGSIAMMVYASSCQKPFASSPITRSTAASTVRPATIHAGVTGEGIPQAYVLDRDEALEFYVGFAVDLAWRRGRG